MIVCGSRAFVRFNVINTYWCCRGGTSAISLMTSSPSLEISGFESVTTWGYPICSSVDNSNISSLSEENKSTFNLSSTELRLGLPGFLCLSSGRLDEKPLFPFFAYEGFYLLVIAKGRGLSATREGFRRHGWVFEVKSTVYNEGNWIFLHRGPTQICSIVAQGKLHVSSGESLLLERALWSRECHRERDYTSQGIQSDMENSGPGALYVKVGMDGAPYLRKVDLNTYFCDYQELSLSLEKMFSCFIIVHVGHMELPGRESKHRDLLHGSEYVLAYEDKDGDWLQVGDVPW
ncbi:hypothetical protein MKW92_012862, partial [Papaver armeniacum]